jgi:hypothetical protein
MSCMVCDTPPRGGIEPSRRDSAGVSCRTPPVGTSHGAPRNQFPASCLRLATPSILSSFYETFQLKTFVWRPESGTSPLPSQSRLFADPLVLHSIGIRASRTMKLMFFYVFYHFRGQMWHSEGRGNLGLPGGIQESGVYVAWCIVHLQPKHPL